MTFMAVNSFKVNVVARRSETGVDIRGRNNDTGIPDGVKTRLFQPFFTTKPTGEGTSLSLSLSYDIVTKGHGEMLEVQTQPDKFTEFISTLPIG